MTATIHSLRPFSVLAERERCATIAERMSDAANTHVGHRIARAIRSRPAPTPANLMIRAQLEASKALETDGPNAAEILREAARFFERQMVELDRQADEIEANTASLPQRTIADVLGADVVARAMAYGDDEPPELNSIAPG